MLQRRRSNPFTRTVGTLQESLDVSADLIGRLINDPTNDTDVPLDPLHFSLAKISPTLRNSNILPLNSRKSLIAETTRVIAALDSTTESGIDDLLAISMDLLSENGLCSFNKHYVSTWSSEPEAHVEELEYVCETLALNRETLHRIRTIHDRPGVAQEIRRGMKQQLVTVFSRYSELWDVVFEVRLSLFGTQPQDMLVARRLPIYDKIEGVIVSLVRAIVDVSQSVGHEPGLTTMGTLFVIFLFIWMYSPSMSRRTMCLSWMGSSQSPGSARSRSALSAADSWGRVQEVATASGIITSGTFPGSLRRDLKDERVLNGNLNDIGCLLVFYITSPQPPDSFLAHELLFHALAAARRGLCMASAGSSFQLGPLLTYAVPAATRGETDGLCLPEHIIHQIISLLGFAIMRDKHAVEFEGFMDLIDICRRDIQRLPIKTNYKLNVMRRTTLEIYREALLSLHRIVGSQIRQGITKSWYRLGNALPQYVPRTRSERLPPVLNRCALRFCLCNAHKPAHRMRVCGGCHRVAYCSPQCQEQDWIKGGHKAFCNG